MTDDPAEDSVRSGRAARTIRVECVRCADVRSACESGDGDGQERKPGVGGATHPSLWRDWGVTRTGTWQIA